MTYESATSRICFPEWAFAEISRLLQARQLARTSEEQVQCDLQLAIIHDVAHRYGSTLVELSEI